MYHDRLKQARKAKNLTQSELSKQLGMPQSHLSKIEAGLTDLRLSSLVELARLLDLEPMLIPKRYLPTVTAIINEADSRKPAWQADEESGDD